MPITSGQMFEKTKLHAEKLREEIKSKGEEIENTKNLIKIEEKVLSELDSKETELLDIQKYKVQAIKDELAIEENRLDEIKLDFKLICKKIEVLNCDTWSF